MAAKLNFKTIIFVVLISYIVSPVIWKHSVFIQRKLLFMHNVNFQRDTNLTHPEQHGIKCSRTLNLTNELEKSQHIHLGAWHILPESSLGSCVTTTDTNRTSIDDTKAFADRRPIVFYVHGNGGNRGVAHRINLYNKLANEFDAHIITFDYRGYGDSSQVEPSRDGITLDANYVYNWLLLQPGVSLDRITVWGHSLGTAVATRFVAQLPDDKKPHGLILEAPFDSIGNAVKNHPFSMPFRVLPYFEYFFIDPITQSTEFNFDSADSIAHLKSTRVLIAHAEDDGIIPYTLGHNLYKRASKSLGESQVQYIQIEASHKLGHKFICKHEDTMMTIRKFIDSKV